MKELLNLCFQLGFAAACRETLAMVEQTQAQTLALRKVVESLAREVENAR